jgi:hypothetical protein
MAAQCAEAPLYISDDPIDVHDSRQEQECDTHEQNVKSLHLLNLTDGGHQEL